MQREEISEAERILEASRDDLDEKWLTFWIEGQLFGISIVDVEQIISMQPITEVPEYPVYAKGIINLRGNIIPVLDLRLCLGKQEMEYNDHTCIVISMVRERPFGLIVDEVDAVIDIPETAVSPPPRIGDDVSGRYLTGVARIPGEQGTEKIVLCLDAAKILHEEEYERLSMSE